MAPRAVRFVAVGTLASALSLAVALGLSGCAAPEVAPGSPAGSHSPDATATPAPGAGATTAPTPTRVDLSAELAAIESRYGVTIGVSARSTTGVEVEHRASDRFGYASTLKVFAAALLLATTSPEQRAATLTWTQADVDTAGYSPVTGEHIDSGLTLAELAEAAVRRSDNTALNLVLTAVGGPDALQGFLRTLGDDSTMVGAFEPELNTVTPGDPANTTTPSTYRAALQRVFDGGVLSDADAATLRQWMSGNGTGDTLIRAGAPEGWIVADKSGGAGGIRNDIARVTTPEGEEIDVVILTATVDPAAPYDDAAVAETARVVLDAMR